MDQVDFGKREDQISIANRIKTLQTKIFNKIINTKGRSVDFKYKKEFF